VLHELGTNAAKYGALSDQDGHVRISWRKEKVDGSARLRFSWQERSSQPLPPFKEQGFGTRLIERACSYQLNGSVERRHTDDGLSYEIVFPLS
jgi:two-component system CheB/CheR fusion protein